MWGFAAAAAAELATHKSVLEQLAMAPIGEGPFQSKEFQLGSGLLYALVFLDLSSVELCPPVPRTFQFSLTMS